MTGRETVLIDMPGAEVDNRYIAPPSVPSRLVGMRVSINSQTSTSSAVVQAKEASNTNPTFSIDLNGKAAGKMHVADYDSSATSAEKMQEFDNSKPVELSTTNLSSASTTVVVYLEFDPFMIGQGQDSIYA